MNNKKETIKSLRTVIKSLNSSLETHKKIIEKNYLEISNISKEKKKLEKYKKSFSVLVSCIDEEALSYILAESYDEQKDEYDTNNNLKKSGENLVSSLMPSVLGGGLLGTLSNSLFGEEKKTKRSKEV